MNPDTGVFESILVVDGDARRAADHLARLRRSCRAVYGHDLPDDLAEAVQRAAADAGGGRHALRVAARPIPGGSSVDLVTRPLHPPPRSTELSLHPRSVGDWSHKWLDRAELTAAEQACAPALPYFCGPGGQVAEMSRGNLFCRLDDGDRWLTPPTDRDALPGVTRAAVIDLLRRAGHDVGVEAFPPAALHAARAVLWTSSLSGAVGVHAVDGHCLAVDESALARLNTELGTGEDVLDHE